MAALLFSGALFGTAVQALALWAPKETVVPVIAAAAASPRPTLPPSFQDLRKRQSSSSEDTFLVGPDRTCGFISGLPGAGFACQGTSDTCVLVPATSATPGFVGCCDDQDCGVRVTCFDYDEISSSSLCDNGCMVDTFTAKCTDFAEPFCNTVSFPGEIYDYYCNSLSISTPQLAFTTYDGETDGRSFATSVYSDTSSDLFETSSGSKQSTAGTGSSSPTASSTSTSSSPASTSGSGTGGGSKTPIGAIVGGVVGGVAVLGLLGLGIAFFARRRGNTPSRASPQTSLPPQPPVGPGPHQSFYDPSQGDPTKHNSTVLVNGQPMTQAYGTPPPPPFSAQPYPGPPVDGQGGYPPPQGAGAAVPLSAGEYNGHGTVPISPSSTVAARQSYQTGFGAPPGQPVHEIDDGGHKGTMSELG